MDTNNQNYDLLFQEIEGVDSYWGPTFRAIYECEDPLKFMEKLDSRIQNHDKEIERMCNTYYQGFIDSIRDLQQVRCQAKNLNKKVVDTGNAIQIASKRFEKKCEELLESRRVESNIESAINTLTTCIPVFVTYNKLQKQISEKRYYPALKTLEQLEHIYLSRVSHLTFFQQMIENIPKIRENIKDISMSDFKDFLENIRRLSTKIGEVAMRHTAEEMKSDLEALDLKMSLGRDKIGGDCSDEEMLLGSDEDISAQHLIDFSPIYRCSHIYSVLGDKEVFENYYRTQREKQARLVIQPSFGVPASIQDFEIYLRNVVGFFVQEDHILNTGNGLIDRSYLNNLWSTCRTKIISIFKLYTNQCKDADFLLRLKYLILLFAASLRNYGYSVNPIFEFLYQLKDYYNEILMQRWVSVFQNILNEESFLPIEVNTVSDYERVLKTFPYTDTSVDAADLPKKFPFSGMVPKVYHQVKEFIYAGLKFSEDLHLSQRDVQELMKNATTSLLSKTFGSCLSALFHKPTLTLPQIIQIIVDTGYLEKSSIFLDEFVINISRPVAEMQISSKNDSHLFKEARDDAEQHICSKLKNKIDEFLELENYDWNLVEPQGHASSFITDLIAFLRTTFESFTNLPLEVAQKACHSACEHIANSLLLFLTTNDVKSISMGAIQQINLDSIQCEQFAACEPVPQLEDGVLLNYFNELRHLLDLLMSCDWSTYFHDYGRENSKYRHVNPITAIIVLEKLGADKKSMFSSLKKSERDKQKLLGTVLKHLRQLTSINYDKPDKKDGE